MNTLCNETLRLVVNAVTDGSIPTLRGCSKEFKSLTSDRYIAVQSKRLLQITRELDKKNSDILTAGLALYRASNIIDDELLHIHPDNDFDAARDLCKYAIDLLDDDPLPDFKWDINNYSAALRHYDEHKGVVYHDKYHHIDDWFLEHCNW